MTELDRLRLQVRALVARVAALEASRRSRPKRPAAPRPDDGIIASRERLSSRYVLLHVQHRGRVTKLNFCMRHRLNPSELGRWLSRTDRRGIAVGSTPDQRFREALEAAIAGLESKDVLALSHGKMDAAPFSVARPH